MTGAELISKERERQVSQEGWSAEHDDNMHSDGELSKAASVYALTTQENVVRTITQPEDSGWPWESQWFKPFAPPPPEDPRFERSFPEVDRIRCLVKAGALIAAEIDRLQRMESDANED